jgi:DNA-binding transcriptional ArsR family regulator
MRHERILELDPVIHAPMRLAILSILVSVNEAGFNFLRESTGATDGNLSTHLTKLEKSGYVKITKTFKGKKPHTSCSITRKGRRAFQQYLSQLEKIVDSRKHGDEK